MFLQVTVLWGVYMLALAVSIWDASLGCQYLGCSSRGLWGVYMLALAVSIRDDPPGDCTVEVYMLALAVSIWDVPPGYCTVGCVHASLGCQY